MSNTQTPGQVGIPGSATMVSLTRCGPISIKGTITYGDPPILIQAMELGLLSSTIIGSLKLCCLILSLVLLPSHPPLRPQS
ncbi:unnamed protein product [Linum tenue]|uniref:Uncharacterized protein n=1 Tax=Linum tenue TaxID=586396 RepID=A0AAV0KIP6_9ROSI|nr:unnamed protein product [Linum tenue]